ncbi:MAG TPA: hypothetical protein VIK55_17020 [Paludibacter sp.]
MKLSQAKIIIGVLEQFAQNEEWTDPAEKEVGRQNLVTFEDLSDLYMIDK